MTRNALLGALAFGLTAAAAGYVWVAFEFPFAIVVPAIVGWAAVTLRYRDLRSTLIAATVGGIAFTALFIGGLFLAIADGSPVQVAGWLVAVIAAAAAGGVVGAVLGGMQGARVLAIHSGIGMAAAVIVAGVLREIGPAAADMPGAAQSAYAAVSLGLIAALVGAAAGAGVARMHDAPDVDAPSAPLGGGRPHAV